MIIREDIYPKIRDSPEKQKYLNALAEIALESYGNSFFQSKEDVIEYLNNFDSPEIAELFLEVGQYYQYSKYYYCPNCFPIQRIDLCPECKSPMEIPAHLVLIMLLSIIERLSLGLREYMSFFDWIAKDEIVEKHQKLLESGNVKNCKELVHSLRENWRQDYGSIAHVRLFFQKFLTKEEKIDLIKSVRYLKKVPELPPKNIDKLDGKSDKEMWDAYAD